MADILKVGKVGFTGRDPLREKAEKMMKGEMKSKVYSPMSQSAVQNEKMMPYKRGGHVSPSEKTVEVGHTKRGSRIPTNLHIPKLEKFHQPSLEKKVTSLKKAGGPMTREKTVATYKRGGSNELTVNKKAGGCLTEKEVNHKRGGEHKKHFGWGGPLGGMVKNIPIIGNLASMFGMKDGGEMKKKGGGCMKKAAGGSIYQRQMMGEKKASAAPSPNYESEMRGEHAVKKAFAKGGVGKIRHNAMTMNGMPKAPKKP